MTLRRNQYRHGNVSIVLGEGLGHTSDLNFFGSEEDSRSKKKPQKPTDVEIDGEADDLVEGTNGDLRVPGDSSDPE